TPASWPPDTRASMAGLQASTAVARHTAVLDLSTDFHRTIRIDFPRITAHFDTIPNTTGVTSPSGHTSTPSFLLLSASRRILTLPLILTGPATLTILSRNGRGLRHPNEKHREA